ncbi:hypothetical protein C9397_13960 [Xanthomonas vasicola pv. vasculorum]|nr:hypothetical protein C7V42_16715 [Xanthomonas vasicola pv. vasculorum]TWQ08348.1 hypothetical protein FQK02_05500 [Xanthomonas vasicola]AZM72201.1 hypothetical protein CXP37_16735 [Xanthomonas vasicola pv. vasculorum]PUE71877.1 hypothetical protein C7Y61_22395 [Xanthomonas vasicola pv. vasculorum]RNL04356.1 hypothetical protein C9397_13960 [Xanthomonas vasicola pv. vasculorum]
MALQKGQRLREVGQFEVAEVGQIKSAGDRGRGPGRTHGRSASFDYENLAGSAHTQTEDCIHNRHVSCMPRCG